MLMMSVCKKINIKVGNFVFVSLSAVLLFSYICIAPNANIFFYNGKRIAEISLILLVLIMLSVSSAIQKNFIQSLTIFDKKSLALWLIILGMGGISAFLSASPRNALIEIITLFSLPLIALQCGPAWRLFPKILPWLSLALLFSFSLLEVKFFSYYCAFLMADFPFSIHNFFFNFAHPRFFNQYQIWTMPLLSAVLLMDHDLFKQKKVRVFIWSVAVVWWMIFFVSGGRGVIVAVIASAVFTYILFRENSKAFLKLTLFLGGAGFLLFQALFHVIPYLLASDSLADTASLFAQSLEIRMTSSHRLTYVWPKAIEYMTKNPWFGVGPMHYAWYPNKEVAHPHSSVLQLAAEWGLPVLMLSIVLFYRTFQAWISRFNRHTLIEQNGDYKLAVISLNFALCSALILSLLSGVIVMPMSHLMGVFVLSLALAIYQKTSLVIEDFNFKHNWTMTFIFAFIAISYFWLLVPELMPRLIDPAFQSENKYDVVGPRFWFRGDISP